MSSSLDRQLPPVDLHAHLAPDVTSSQLLEIRSAVTFAVTRSLDEAEAVGRRRDPNVIWGCGVHPGVREALESFSRSRFEDLLERFIFVGEVGLDRRGGPVAIQRQVLTDVLEAVSERHVVVSVHSAGRAREIVEFIELHRPLAPVLHWFTGSPDLVERAAKAGAYFSINGAAKPDLVASLPQDRVLTETDFPFTRRQGASAPGSVARIEDTLSTEWGVELFTVRKTIWRNLRSLVMTARVLDRLPAEISTPLLSA